MKRIEMLCDVKDAPGYLKGEVRLVSPETAGYFCGLGWAKDLTGEIATGTPSTGETVLAVQGGVIGQAAQTPGVE